MSAGVVVAAVPPMLNDGLVREPLPGVAVGSIFRAAGAFVLALLVPACAGPLPGDVHGDDDDGPVEADPEVPPRDFNEVEITTPELLIPAGREILWCYFSVWEDETVGVDRVEVFDSPFSHHTLLKSVPSDDPMPEEFLLDCTAPTGDMNAYSVLFEGYVPEDDGLEEDHGDDDDDAEGNLWMELPEGSGVKMAVGQRWMVDGHFINPTDQDITTRITFQLRTLPEESVEAWVGAWTHHAGTLELPPGEITSRENACSWSEEMSILSIGPHMHEFGYAYTVDLHRVDGSVERVLTRDTWDPEWRLDPVVDYFAEGALVVHPGDEFVTTCTWNNTTDHVLDYPDEMCSTFGLATPLETAFECYGGVVNDGR